MERPEAAALLGVPPDADRDAVRAAYRVRMRRHHPDLAGTAATAEAARINEAYRVLRRPVPVSTPITPPASPPAAPTASGRAPGDGPESFVVVDDDTVGFAFPADEVFLLLVDAAHGIGEVTYMDPEAGLLEALVDRPPWPPCSILITLQGRADLVEAFCTVEARVGREAPPVGEVVSLLLRTLRASARDRTRSRD